MGPLKKNSKQIYAALTTGTGAYSAGQVIGGPVELKDFFESLSGVSEIVDMEAFDFVNQKSLLNVVIFSSKPAGTYADGTTFNPSATDLALIDALVPMPSASYVSFNAANALGTVTNIRNKVGASTATNQLGSGTHAKSAWMVVVSGGTPTYGITAGLAIQFGIEQDI